MNIAIIEGRLTADPDIRKTDTTTVSRFRLAVNRDMKKDEADFISCVAFGKTAEFMENYCMKGQLMQVEGRIQTGNYKDKDGKTIYTTDVIAGKIRFAPTNNRQEREKAEEQPKDEFMDALPDDGLPFD